MPLAFVIDALRELAPTCPGGEAVLLEAAEHLAQMSRQIPPAEPTR